jgi:hypothetical protein
VIFFAQFSRVYRKTRPIKRKLAHLSEAAATRLRPERAWSAKASLSDPSLAYT